MQRPLTRWPTITNLPTDDPVGAHFTSVDAIVPVPGSGLERQFYFFSGRHYIRIRLNAAGRDIPNMGRRDMNTWTTIPATFTRVNAGMRVPGTQNELYLFSGTRVIRCTLADDLDKNDTAVAMGDFEQQMQPLLPVDAIMPTPNSQYQHFFFRGKQYQIVTFNKDGTPRRTGVVRDLWPDLVDANFDKVDACMLAPSQDNQEDHAYIFHGGSYIKTTITEVAEPVWNAQGIPP